jgi:hypothetical protein
MGKYIPYVVGGLILWFVYFQTIDWFFMKIQGLSYFAHISSVF